MDFLNKSFVHLVLIVLLGLVVYSNTFNASFHLDDYRNIVESPFIKDLSNFSGLLSEENGEIHFSYRNRSVGYLTFALNYWAHGLDVKGYHAVNLAIHIINALLVYWLVVLTFRTPFLSRNNGIKEHSRYIALFSALLFVSHPVQTQAVTYIVQRFASLATLFYLLSLTMYIRCRLIGSLNSKSITLYALSLISALLAMKTKEIAFTLPVVIALFEFMFFSGTRIKRLLYLTPLIFTMLIIPLTMLGTDMHIGEIIGDVGETSRLQTEMSRLDYLFTEFRVVVTYIRLLALPINQNLDYDYPTFHSLFAPQVFLSFMFLLSIFGLGLYMLCRSRTSEPALRVISFGIFWFFITLSVESSIIPIEDVIYEHRLYLPDIGAFMAAVAGVFLASKKLGDKKIRTAGIGLFVLLALALSSATYARNSVWQSGITLWEDVVNKSPGKPRAYTNLGNAYMARGMPDRAIEHYSTALRLKPNTMSPGLKYNFAKIYHNLGVAYKSKGLADRAIQHYRIAISLNPDYTKAHYNLGNAYLSKGLTDKAIEQYKNTIRLDHYHLGAHTNLAAAYERKGLHEKAAEHRRMAEGLEQR